VKVLVILEEAEIAEGTRRSNLDELTRLSVAADKVLIF
jgi:sulfur relay (sulfurtransferase) complex TusBCD TusD component (DsrE family)